LINPNCAFYLCLNSLIEFQITALTTALDTGAGGKRIPGNRIVLDIVGLGAGVVDNLRAQSFKVREFISGAKPKAQGGTAFTFRNLRSQGYWRLRELFKDELIQIPDHQRAERGHRSLPIQGGWR